MTFKILESQKIHLIELAVKLNLSDEDILRKASKIFDRIIFEIDDLSQREADEMINYLKDIK